MLDDEEIGWADPKEHQGMAIQPVGQATPAPERCIFADRQRGDVADAAPVEITGVRVMHVVGATPVVVGRQGQQADDAANQVVGAARLEI